jgi:hypothetical protein
MRAVKWLLIVALPGCASSPTSAPIEDTNVVIGGASDDGTAVVDWHAGLFTPPILMGPQGGQHIWVSVRAGHGFHAKSMRFTIDMTDLDTGEVVKPGTIPVTATMSDVGDALQVTNLRGYVKEPCKIKGHRVHIRVGLEDLMGLTGSDEVDIKPQWSGFCGS